MHKILSAQQLAPSIFSFKVHAPLVAKNALAGQFVVIICDEQGERIPLTICDKDADAITIIFQVAGTSTAKLSKLNIGDNVSAVLGPLGHPTPVKNYGKAICLGAGVGIAEIYPVAMALKKARNDVTIIIGSRNKELLLLENDLRKISDKILISTDDGSCGKKGFVTDLLSEQLLNDKFDIVFCVGPIPMMKKTCDITKGYNLKTIVSLNSNMLDATGMCATCRIKVAGKMKFTCVDGPDFDGHEVDFEELAWRDKRFAAKEKESYEKYKHKCACR